MAGHYIGNKPSPEPVMTKMYDIIMALLGHNEYTVIFDQIITINPLCDESPGKSVTRPRSLGTIPALESNGTDSLLTNGRLL